MFDVHFFPFDPPTQVGVQLQELIVLSTHTIKLAAYGRTFRQDEHELRDLHLS